MLLRQEAALGVFIDNVDVAIAIFAGEEEDSVMLEAIVERTEPFDGACLVEPVHDMNVAAEVGEELAGGDVPIPMEPSAALPTGEAIEALDVAGIDESVVGDGSGDESGVGREVES